VAETFGLVEDGGFERVWLFLGGEPVVTVARSRGVWGDRFPQGELPMPDELGEFRTASRVEFAALVRSALNSGALSAGRVSALWMALGRPL
jgi:hypothetical protein